MTSSMQSSDMPEACRFQKTYLNRSKRRACGVHEISKAFRSARDEYDRLVTELDTATSASTPSAVAMKELRQRIDHLWQEYDGAKENMLRVGDDLLRNAASKSAEANQVAARFKQLSYAFYIIGTMIILFGRAKVLSVRKRNRPC